MDKFKIGQYVKVLSKHKKAINWYPAMNKFIGNIYKIQAIDNNTSFLTHYILQDEQSVYCFMEEVLKRVKNPDIFLEF